MLAMAISGLASTQPKTVILSLFKIAVRQASGAFRLEAGTTFWAVVAHAVPGTVDAAADPDNAHKMSRRFMLPSHCWNDRCRLAPRLRPADRVMQS